jgi:hypothetical protein
MEQNAKIFKLRDIELVHLHKIIKEGERVSPREYNCKDMDELNKHIENELNLRQIFHVH